MTGRLGIDDVQPLVSAGSHPAKAVVGEVVPVSAVVWREGHDKLAATLSVRGPRQSAPRRIPMVLGDEPDIYHALFTPTAEGMWTFRVDAWSDPVATWRHAVTVKIEAGQDAAALANDLESGARLLERASAGVPRPDREPLLRAIAALRSDAPLLERVGAALGDHVADILDANPLRELLTRGKTQRIWVDRKRALFGSWYEFFPRSTGGRDDRGNPVHGTFRTATAALDRIARMGFDVVYLPPIHPIGEVNRKGRNNTLVAEPGDVGSPWAIGSHLGGHDAVHPELGNLDDFRAFVARAGELGMEVALDLALQCAPDHPWAREHPEWFTVLPDGTIAYAENPPKKYQDIYPLNFDDDPQGLYSEVLRVVRHWMDAGVRIFRVDNPHTKPPNFWEWLITQIKLTDPDVLFLSEAFTRPARMYGLAKLGFTQSYSYFTWRVAKWELTEFGEEIVANADHARPNLFVNTPDILHETLQKGGPGMFAIRAALAATMGASWGIYSGFELYESTPVREGSEEYLDSEKYELRPRDFDTARERGESLELWLTALNGIRRRHPALQQQRYLHFHHVDNEAIIAYSKFDPGSGDCVLTVISLNPFGPEEGTIWLDMPAIGRDWQDHLDVRDEVTGQAWLWGQANYVRLEPWNAVAHVIDLGAVGADKRAELAFRAGGYGGIGK